MNTAIPNGSIASGTATSVHNKRFERSASELPPHIALIGQPSDVVSSVAFDVAKRVISADDVASLYGKGSPLHLASLVLYNQYNSIGAIPVDVFPIEITGGTEASGSLGFTGTQTKTGSYTLVVSGKKIPFTIVKGATAAEIAIVVKDLIDSHLPLPIDTEVIAGGAIPLKAKWSGLTGDEIGLSIDGTEHGIVFTVTAMNGGAGLPDISTALTNFNEPYTDVLVQFSDTAALSALETKNEDLWKPETATPYSAYHGSKLADKDAVSTDTETRKDQRTICCFPIPGSPSTCFEIASSLVANVVITKDDNPPVPYGGAICYGVLPGDTFWTRAEQDYILMRGCSTSKVDKGVVKALDIITTHHPEDEEYPGFRYVVNIAKLQLILNGFNFLFKGEKYTGKILVKDTAIVKNKKARRPSHAKADIFKLLDEWGTQGVIEEVAFSKKGTIVEIDSTNGDRFNITVPLILTKSVRQKSIEINFSTEVIGA